MLNLRSESGRSTLIPFIMAGDPTLEVSERLACALIEEGAGILEIGVPFSDAMADGPVIQKAGQRALREKVNLEKIFAMTHRISQRFPRVPLVLFSYLNPLLQYGLARYTEKARHCGIHATLTVDLPLESAQEYCDLHNQHGLKTVFLVAPTTHETRMQHLVQASTGFVYVISRTGVTGTHAGYAATLEPLIKKIRPMAARGLAVGFGLSNAEQVSRVASLADGIVVGSAFVKLVEEAKDPLQLESKIRHLARQLTVAL